MILNTTPFQSKKATIIAIVIICIAVVGTVGLVVWNNFESSVVRQETATSSLGTASPSNSNGTGTLAFPEWNINLPLGRDYGVAVGDYTAPSGNSSTSYYQLVASSGAIKDCSNNSPTPIGTVMRVKDDEKYTAYGAGGGTTWAAQAKTMANAVDMTGYVYVYTPPQTHCGDPKTDAGKQANAQQIQLESQVYSLISILKKL